MAGPLLCDPDAKAGLEARNGVEQLDYISYLVNDLRIADVRDSHVLEFHSIAIRDIYPCGGQYRDAAHRVSIRGSDHVLPEAARVPGLVHDLIDTLNRHRRTRSAIERAAFALWRFNWIHPFRGGNGRTGRALSYLVICLDLGLVPPGLPQVPTLIYKERRRYIEGLRDADRSAEDGRELDLRIMTELIEHAVTMQLASAIDSLGAIRSSDEA